MKTRPWARLTLLVLTALVGPLAACGEPRSTPRPAESKAPAGEPAGETAAETAAAAAGEPGGEERASPRRGPPLLDEPPLEGRVGIDPDLDAAWAMLSEPRGWLRSDAVARLLAAEATIDELVTHAAREACRQRDVGLLADLLAGQPDEVLPLLLWKLYRTAPRRRAAILRALGRRRLDGRAAEGLLLGRLVLSEFRVVQEACAEALLALQRDGDTRPGPPPHGGPDARLAWVVARAQHARQGAAQPGDVPRVLLRVLLFELASYGPESAAEVLRVADALPLTEAERALMVRVVVKAGVRSARLTERLMRGAHVDVAPLQKALGGLRPSRSARMARREVAQQPPRFSAASARWVSEPDTRAAALAELLWLGTASSARVREALFHAWREGPDDTARAALRPAASPLLLVLRVLRPRGRELDYFLRRLHTEGVTHQERRLALDMVAWCHERERQHVRAVIGALLRDVVGEDRASQSVRRRAYLALQTLRAGPAWFLREGAHALAAEDTFAVHAAAGR